MEVKLRAALDARARPGDDHRRPHRRRSPSPASTTPSSARGATPPSAPTLIFVDAPRDEADLEAIAGAGIGAPLLVNVSEHGKTPDLGVRRFAELGFRVVLYPSLDALRRRGLDRRPGAPPARGGHDGRRARADDAVRGAQRGARQGRVGRPRGRAARACGAGASVVSATAGTATETVCQLLDAAGRPRRRRRARDGPPPHAASACGARSWSRTRCSRASGRPRSRRRRDPGRRRGGRGLRGAGRRARRSPRCRPPPSTRAAGDYDGFVGLGGGSALDTVKAARAARDARRRDPRLGQPADRRRARRPRAAAARGRAADDRRHRLGGHRGRGPRRAGAPREDGHLAPAPAPAAGDLRSRADGRLPARGDRRRRARRAHARHRGLRVAALRRPPAPGRPRRAAAVPGREPARRRVGGARDRARRPLPAPGRGGRQRPRGAPRDAAVRDVRRHRLRQRRRARPARVLLPHRGPAPRLGAARASRARAAACRTASRSSSRRRPGCG